LGPEADAVHVTTAPKGTSDGCEGVNVTEICPGKSFTARNGITPSKRNGFSFGAE
jgi:hypothetical protein